MIINYPLKRFFFLIPSNKIRTNGFFFDFFYLLFNETTPCIFIRETIFYSAINLNVQQMYHFRRKKKPPTKIRIHL